MFGIENLMIAIGLILFPVVPVWRYFLRQKHGDHNEILPLVQLFARPVVLCWE